MLMSWGGEMAAEAGLPDLEAEVLRSSQAVWDEGVGHNDERDPNLLWNDERSRVMLIDFDRAALRPAPKYKRIVSLSGGKRKRQRDSLRNHPQKRDFQQGYLQSVE
ncbi:hypothetical protein TOPH_02901 [Tolypocladium ophioglossoides CBS 100239]|uniref:Protein kinase domain-containing protein n=1 Tax=Tolypocladium ophioglossoides (strain CBS 100239) TaxID=1163406 RepID=A0A0L0NEK7_TOLOC|nr:hypothetical protein TOPH_02901 [Tolypocladium ophioglossoides CBS 100239]